MYYNFIYIRAVTFVAATFVAVIFVAVIFVAVTRCDLKHSYTHIAHSYVIPNILYWVVPNTSLKWMELLRKDLKD